MTPHAPPAAAARPDAATRTLRAAVLLLLLALAALCVAWEWVLAPTGRRTLVVKALPLLLALPGVLRHRLYTFRWLALLVWLYVLEGVVRAAGGGALPLVEVALALALFAACAAYVRWRLRRGRLRDAAAVPTTTAPAAKP